MMAWHNTAIREAFSSSPLISKSLAPLLDLADRAC